MRQHLSKVLLLLMAASAATTVHAQFQAPTPEELKMTEDVKAPGADIVYLNYDSIYSKVSETHNIHARLKVLTEKGKDAATFTLYRSKMSDLQDIRLRTIHPDGTIIEVKDVVKQKLVTEKKTATEEGSKSSDTNDLIFSFPDVTVGSIVEYVCVIPEKSTFLINRTFDIQRKHFIHQAYYGYILSSEGDRHIFTKPSPAETTPAVVAKSAGEDKIVGSSMQDEQTDLIEVMAEAEKADKPGLKTRTVAGDKVLNIYSKLPEGAHLERHGEDYAIIAKDLQPEAREDFAPYKLNSQYFVRFYWTTGDANSMMNELARNFTRSMDHFTTPKKNLGSEVSQLVASSESDTAKAEKLYKLVQSYTNTDYSHDGSAGDHRGIAISYDTQADAVIREKKGNSNEIALAYLTLLRTAGVKADAVIVCDRQTRVCDPNDVVMLDTKLRNIIVRAYLNGKAVYLDPGAKMAPYGLVRWSFWETTSFVRGADVIKFMNTPANPGEHNEITRKADVVLQANGDSKAEVQIVMTGQQALYWRLRALRFADDYFKRGLEKTLTRLFPDGMEVHLDHISGLTEPDADLTIFMKASGKLGSIGEKGLELPSQFFASTGKEPFVKASKRQASIDMNYVNHERDVVTYHIPEMLHVGELPQDSAVEWNSHALFSASVRQEGNAILCKRDLNTTFVKASVSDYAYLRPFYMKVASAEQKRLVLVNASTASLSK